MIPSRHWFHDAFTHIDTGHFTGSRTMITNWCDEIKLIFFMLHICPILVTVWTLSHTCSIEKIMLKTVFLECLYMVTLQISVTTCDRVVGCRTFISNDFFRISIVTYGGNIWTLLMLGALRVNHLPAEVLASKVTRASTGIVLTCRTDKIVDPELISSTWVKPNPRYD